MYSDPSENRKSKNQIIKNLKQTHPHKTPLKELLTNKDYQNVKEPDYILLKINYLLVDTNDS